MPKFSKKKILITCAVLVVSSLLAAGIIFSYRTIWKNYSALKPNSLLPKPPVTTTQLEPKSAPTPPVTIPTSELATPVADFKTRITKKFFGTYVTPQNSPVQPERFSGYHTGVDVEYGDVNGVVPVYAIASGTVTYSSWVSGYGGVVCIRSTISGTTRTVLYGHLSPSTLPAVGSSVTKGVQIGQLGQAYSSETDGERRHLHLSIIASTSVNLRGYVSNQTQLSGWIDPLSLSY